MKHNWFRRYWYWVTIAVILIIAGALISAFRSNPFCESIITFFDDWSVALSAGAAVILAVAAFRTIRISSEQKQLLNSQTEFLNDQIRLLRQERLLKILDDVHIWANDMTNFHIEIQKGRTAEEIRIFSVVHWAAALKAHSTNGESLKRQVENIWSNLGPSIDKVLSNINELRRYVLSEYQGKSQNKVAVAKAGAINTSAQELLAVIDSIKSFILSQ